MNNINSLFVAVLLMLLSHKSAAQQISYSKVDKGDFYQFNYQWLDHHQQSQSMAFSLSKNALFNKFRSFKVYKPELALQFISRKVIKELHNNPIHDVKIHYNNQTGDIRAEGKNIASIAIAERKITQLNNKFTHEYLKEHWYHTFTTHNHLKAIKPDHVTFASLSTEDIKPIRPIILEKVSVKNIRKATNYVLAFVQSIPYSPLSSRVNSSGAGFNPPLKLLWENQGDCDSKVTLTASILRSLMPRIKMVLVFIDSHALIGINIEPDGSNTTIIKDGITYTLAEPTGPALLPLGKLSQISELAISQGQYTAETFN
jgi:hypothetical protein